MSNDNEPTMEGKNTNNQNLGSSENASLIIPEEFVLVHTVLNQDLLLEILLDYAIRNPDGTLCGKIIGYLRLVCKHWQLTISNVLRKNREPLYNLTLDQNNSLNESSIVKAHGKILDQFIIATNCRIEKPFPTFSLVIRETFFRRENYDSFYKFLLDCGQGLVKLHLRVPENAGSLPGIFPNVSLPILKKLSVQRNENELQNLPREDVVVGHSSNITFLVQSLLNKNESLKELELLFTERLCSTPAGLQYLAWPLSITKLALEYEMNNQELERLSSWTLPNLKDFEWLVPNRRYKEGIISNILINFSKTLRILSFGGLMFDGPPKISNLVKFPKMEKLEQLNIWTINLESESEITSIDNLFPELTAIALTHSTWAMLRKWVGGSPASKVKFVNLELVNSQLNHTQAGFYLPLKQKYIQLVHATFPNVTSLRVKLTAEQICGINYIFLEMRQLTFLRIDAGEHESVKDSDTWDSIFTGIPKTIIKGMRLNEDFCKYMDFKNPEFPSITMLTELKTLELVTIKNEALPEIPHSPLISDLTFAFALDKMPSLKNLTFQGRFKASDKMFTSWKDKGFQVSYQSSAFL